MIRNLQADEKVGDGVVESEEAVGLLGLLDDGVDVGDLGDRFQNLLLLVPVEAALLLRLLHQLVVLLHQSPPQPRLLVLPHPEIRLLFASVVPGPMLSRSTSPSGNPICLKQSTICGFSSLVYIGGMWGFNKLSWRWRGAELGAQVRNVFGLLRAISA